MPPEGSPSFPGETRDGGKPPAVSQKAGTGTLVAFGVGSLAVGVKNTIFGSYLMLFYNQVLGLDPVLAGSALFLALLVDAVSDPLVGQISDHTRSRWGRRHPFIYASLLPFSFATYFLLIPPAGLGPWGLFTYLTVFAIAVRVSMTFYDVPRTALGPELTKDYDQRTTLNGVAWVFGALGAGLTAFLAFTVFFAESPDFSGPRAFLNPDGFRQMGAFGAVAIFFSGAVFAFGTHRHIPDLYVPERERRASLRETLREMIETLSHRSWLMLFLAGIVLALFIGLTSGFSNYYNIYFWEWAPADLAAFPLAHLVAAIGAGLVSTRVAANREKKRTAVALLGCVAALGPLPLILRLIDPFFAFATFPENGTAALWWTLLAQSSVVIGIGVLGFVLLGSMVADVVEDSQRQTGRRSEGLFFSAPALIQKSVVGIGVFATGLLLGAAGFGGTGVVPEDPASAIRRLASFHVALSLTLPLLSIWLISRYEITRRRHAGNLDALGYSQ